MDTISDAGARAPDARSEIVTLSIEELEADPHGVFRRYRALTPFIAHEAGGHAVLRSREAELEEGLRALTERLPQLRLAGDPPRLRGHIGIRRIGDMRVTWRS